ncbi:CHAT domain-containing protein [Actinomycetospora soli]|uniref:CHAT domain-containing protein n=1 Tax=Actinomycetospora soli TaxID=2893887 RepID=UPI001E5C27E2|nr:CHAT domain-containing protein [Actinomycetospora soli]MCD2187877.1 CHAT domain-containing protein [Actinomycetospora soli]
MIDRGVRDLFPDDGPGDVLSPVLGAVRALEPKRARRALADATDIEPTMTAALERLIQLAEYFCWPGAMLHAGDWPPPGAVAAPFEAYWWGEVLPRSLFLRTTQGHIGGEGDSTGEPSEFDRWVERARAAGDPAAAAHARLLEADVARRTGSVTYPRTLTVRVLGDAVALPGVTGAALLLLGDLALTPRSSPETLGSTLHGLYGETEVDIAGAAHADRTYLEARATFERAGREQGVATTDLRRAFVARLRGRPDDAARLLDDAADRSWRAEDGATAVLALVHRTLLQLATPSLPPQVDPTPRIAAWVAEAGSPGWVLGCARVALDAAREAEARGAIEEALSTHGFAERLLDASGTTDQAVLEGRVRLLAQVNSHGLAAASWEEMYAAAENEDAVTFERWERLATALLLLIDSTVAAEDEPGLRMALSRAQALLDRRPPDLPHPVQDRRSRVARWGSGLPPDVGYLADALAARLADLPRLADLYLAIRVSAEGRDATFRRVLERLARPEHVDEPAVRALLLLGRPDEAALRADAWLATVPDLGPVREADVRDLVGESDCAWALLEAVPPPPTPAIAREWDWYGDGLRARVALHRGDADRARAIAEPALERVERWVAGLTSETFRVSALDDGATAELIDVLVLACLRLGDHAAAVTAADRLRSLALGALFDDPGTVAFRLWRQARAEWNGAVDERREVWRDPAPADLARTAAALDEADRKVEKARRRLGTSIPSPPLRPPVDVDEVVDVLGDALLVQYTLAEGRLVVAALTSGGVVRLEEGSGGSVPGLCARVLAGWSGADALRGADDELAALLLGPVADLLEDHARVLVVPCVPALAVPFAALPFAGSCVLDRWTVSQLPSVSLVPRLAGRPRPILDAPCLVVGNPPSHGFDPLPGAEAEAVLAGRSLDAQTLLDANAGEARVRRELTTRTPVAHLACHGVLHPHAPDLSAVMLAGEDRVTVAELLGVGLDVDLAVLSACSSGRGGVTRSGTVVGLSRGLLAAGVRHTVTTMWDVQDGPTCLIMTDFADRLAAGLDVADALARAQRTVRALTRLEIQERYLELGRQAGVALTPEGSRRRRSSGSVSADWTTSPDQWAPFVHLGV